MALRPDTYDSLDARGGATPGGRRTKIIIVTAIALAILIAIIIRMVIMNVPIRS